MHYVYCKYQLKRRGKWSTCRNLVQPGTATCGIHSPAAFARRAAQAARKDALPEEPQLLTEDPDHGED